MNAYTRANQQYVQQGVMTASPMELVVMLYEGAIKHLKRARLFLDEDSLPEANAALMRTTEIITELVMSLDFQYLISDQLLSLYEFALREIREVMVERKSDRIGPVLEILVDLKDAWSQAARETRGESYSIED